MADEVAEIKEKLSIVEVVGGYVTLVKAGRNYKGLCPFHKERTPSFMVSPERRAYHCFGCGRGGDIFSFIEEVERVDFKGALTLLAEKAGVTLSKKTPGPREENERLFSVLHDANEFFVETLARHERARSYLFSRGLTEETLRLFNVGYAPCTGGGWRSLTNHLSARGHTERTIIDSGLAKRPERAEGGAPYDRFRGRIMFPIKDAAGRVIAFSGRIFEDDPQHPQAKYVNSPETPLFHKSRVLHGVHEARSGARALHSVIVVEGQVDLLMAHQAGFTNTVALSGTSFTEEHIGVVQRLSDNLLIAFDGDEAGIRAALKASALALVGGLKVKVAFLDGKDPADLIQADVQGFKAAIRGALHPVDFSLKVAGLKARDPRVFGSIVSKETIPLASLVRSPVERSQLVSAIAQALSIPREAVEEEMRRPGALPAPGAGEAVPERGPGLVRGLVAVFEERGDEERCAFLKRAIHEGGEPGDGEHADVGDRIEADQFLDAHHAALDEALCDLMREYRRERAKREYDTAIFSLKRAEAAGDEDEAHALIQKIALLAKELSER